MLALTAFVSFEKYALITTSLCPANVFGRNPFTGFNVNKRAVISRDVVMKHLYTANPLESLNKEIKQGITLNPVTIQCS